MLLSQIYEGLPESSMARTPDILVTTHSLLTVSGHLQLLDGLSGSKSDVQIEHHNHEHIFIKAKIFLLMITETERPIFKYFSSCMPFDGDWRLNTFNSQILKTTATVAVNCFSQCARISKQHNLSAKFSGDRPHPTERQ